MIPRLLTGALLMSALAAPAAPFLLRSGEEARPPSPPSLERRDDATAPPAAEGGVQFIQLARHRTPFRLGGEPPGLRFGEAPPAPPSPTPVHERPRLLLSGILWGREPVAILEGIPGQEQQVALTQGAEAGGFRIARIERTRVIVAGQDTVWTLEVRTPWQ